MPFFACHSRVDIPRDLIHYSTKEIEKKFAEIACSYSHEASKVLAQNLLNECSIRNTKVLCSLGYYALTNPGVSVVNKTNIVQMFVVMSQVREYYSLLVFRSGILRLLYKFGMVLKTENRYCFKKTVSRSEYLKFSKYVVHTIEELSNPNSYPNLCTDGVPAGVRRLTEAAKAVKAKLVKKGVRYTISSWDMPYHRNGSLNTLGGSDDMVSVKSFSERFTDLQNNVDVIETEIEGHQIFSREVGTNQENGADEMMISDFISTLSLYEYKAQNLIQESVESEEMAHYEELVNMLDYIKHMINRLKSKICVTLDQSYVGENMDSAEYRSSYRARRSGLEQRTVAPDGLQAMQGAGGDIAQANDFNPFPQAQTYPVINDYPISYPAHNTSGYGHPEDRFDNTSEQPTNYSYENLVQNINYVNNYINNTLNTNEPQFGTRKIDFGLKEQLDKSKSESLEGRRLQTHEQPEKATIKLSSEDSLFKQGSELKIEGFDANETTDVLNYKGSFDLEHPHKSTDPRLPNIKSKDSSAADSTPDASSSKEASAPLIKKSSESRPSSFELRVGKAEKHEGAMPTEAGLERMDPEDSVESDGDDPELNTEMLYVMDTLKRINTYLESKPPKFVANSRSFQTIQSTPHPYTDSANSVNLVRGISEKELTKMDEVEHMKIKMKREEALMRDRVPARAPATKETAPTAKVGATSSATDPGGEGAARERNQLFDSFDENLVLRLANAHAPRKSATVGSSVSQFDNQLRSSSMSSGKNMAKVANTWSGTYGTNNYGRVSYRHSHSCDSANEYGGGTSRSYEEYGVPEDQGKDAKGIHTGASVSSKLIFKKGIPSDTLRSRIMTRSIDTSNEFNVNSEYVLDAENDLKQLKKLTKLLLLREEEIDERMLGYGKEGGYVRTQSDRFEEVFSDENTKEDSMEKEKEVAEARGDGYKDGFDDADEEVGGSRRVSGEKVQKQYGGNVAGRRSEKGDGKEDEEEYEESYESSDKRTGKKQPRKSEVNELGYPVIDLNNMDKMRQETISEEDLMGTPKGSSEEYAEGETESAEFLERYPKQKDSEASGLEVRGLARRYREKNKYDHVTSKYDHVTNKFDRRTKYQDRVGADEYRQDRGKLDGKYDSTVKGDRSGHTRVNNQRVKEEKRGQIMYKEEEDDVEAHLGQERKSRRESRKRERKLRGRDDEKYNGKHYYNDYYDDNYKEPVYSDDYEYGKHDQFYQYGKNDRHDKYGKPDKYGKYVHDYVHNKHMYDDHSKHKYVDHNKYKYDDHNKHKYDDHNKYKYDPRGDRHHRDQEFEKAHYTKPRKSEHNRNHKYDNEHERLMRSKTYPMKSEEADLYGMYGQAYNEEPYEEEGYEHRRHRGYTQTGFGGYSNYLQTNYTNYANEYAAPTFRNYADKMNYIHFSTASSRENIYNNDYNDYERRYGVERDGYEKSYRNGYRNGHGNGYENGYGNGYGNENENSYVNAFGNGYGNGYRNGYGNENENSYGNGYGPYEERFQEKYRGRIVEVNEEELENEDNANEDRYGKYVKIANDQERTLKSYLIHEASSSNSRRGSYDKKLGEEGEGEMAENPDDDVISNSQTVKKVIKEGGDVIYEDNMLTVRYAHATKFSPSHYDAGYSGDNEATLEITLTVQNKSLFSYTLSFDYSNFENFPMNLKFLNWKFRGVEANPGERLVHKFSALCFGPFVGLPKLVIRANLDVNKQRLLHVYLPVAVSCFFTPCLDLSSLSEKYFNSDKFKHIMKNKVYFNAHKKVHLAQLLNIVTGFGRFRLLQQAENCYYLASTFSAPFYASSRELYRFTIFAMVEATGSHYHVHVSSDSYRLANATSMLLKYLLQN
nr:hypothetical protein MACL_00002667 [Theileria orientalis]